MTTGGATRIRVCGRLVVEWEGERVDAGLSSPQMRLLFAFLVLNRRRPVRRDELIAALWHDESRPPSGGDALLAPPLSRLRKAIGPGRLEGRGELQLVLPDDAWIDWEAARAGVERARGALLAGNHQAVREPASEVIAIAGAGLLPGLSAGWIEEYRRDLDELRVEALEAIAAAGIALGGAELPGAEQAARQAVEAAPFRESARVALMEALQARGNVAEGLRVYEDLRILLREELGTAPGPRVASLHGRLLAGEDSQPRPASPQPAAVPQAGDPTARDYWATAATATRRRISDHEIVERDRELAELTALAQAAGEGDGRVALIEGPAGIGKSRLLAELRFDAESRDALVLTAHASVLEREFPFGIVRQLFEGLLQDPATRERLMTGAAAPAASVFGAPMEGEADAAGAGFASLHGLMWLTLNVAAERPLVLAIDDLQWSDAPSLRFIAYLVRRLESAPLLVAATLRSAEQPTDTELVAEIAHSPATVPIRPRPLSEQAVAAVIRDRLDADPDAAFAAACWRTTGGNPLLLQELLTGLRADNVVPDATGVELVRDIGPRAVSRGVLLRLARLPGNAVAVARAIAVLGENAAIPAIAGLARIDETAVAEATGALVRAELLHAEPPIAFSHPLIQDVIHRELPPGEREIEHLRAARVLDALGASPEQVSLHLLSTAPRADEWAATTLRKAGATAMSRGAPDSAVTYLRRALAETGLEAPTRPDLLLELGAAELEIDAQAAATHLLAAREALTDPFARGMATFRWARLSMVLDDTDAASGMALATAAELAASSDPALVDMRQRLAALALYSEVFGSTDPEVQARLASDDYRREDDSLGGRMLLGVEAFIRACRAEPVDEVAGLALSALATGSLGGMEHEIPLVTCLVVLSAAGREEAADVLDGVVAEAHRSGSKFAAASAHMWRAELLVRRGELEDTVAECTAGLEEFGKWGRGAARIRLNAYLAEALLESGDLDAAEAALSRGFSAGRSHQAAFSVTNKARLRLAQGRPEEALEAADDAATRCGALLVNPAFVPWRAAKAEALDRLGRTSEALAVAEDNLAIARRWGASIDVGAALRVLGTIERAAGIGKLERAVEELTGTYARLERAKALAALGSAVRRDRRPSDAREPLRMALELADACGAAPLADHVRTELAASGARPRTEALSGVAALTASERRVVDLAMEGQTNRDIAQALYVTPKTVEVHLTNVYRKLGIRSRRELADAVGS